MVDFNWFYFVGGSKISEDNTNKIKITQRN